MEAHSLPSAPDGTNKDNNDHTLKIPLCPVCSVATTVQPLITSSGIIVLTFDYSEIALLFLSDSPHYSELPKKTALSTNISWSCCDYGIKKSL